MASSAQIILTRWAESEVVSISSPQLPGIVVTYDRDPSPIEVMETAIAAGLDPNGDITVHVESQRELQGRSVFLRGLNDYRADRRGMILQDAWTALENGQLNQYLPITTTGDTLIVAALPSDSIESIALAIEPEVPVCVITHSPDGGLEGIPIISSTVEHGPRITDLGLSSSSTVADLLGYNSQSELTRNELAEVRKSFDNDFALVV